MTSVHQPTSHPSSHQDYSDDINQDIMATSLHLKFPHIPEPLTIPSEHTFSAHTQHHIFDLPMAPLSGTPSLLMTPYTGESGSGSGSGFFSDLIEHSDKSTEPSPLFTPTSNFSMMQAHHQSIADRWLATYASDDDSTSDIDGHNRHDSVFSDDFSFSSPTVSPSPAIAPYDLVAPALRGSQMMQTGFSIDPAEMTYDTAHSDPAKHAAMLEAAHSQVFSNMIRDVDVGLFNSELDEAAWAVVANMPHPHHAASVPPQSTQRKLQPSMLPHDHLTRDYSQSPYPRQQNRSSAPPQILKCPHQPCNKTFTRLTNLKAHLRSHSPTKPFDCTRCTRSFSRKHDLQRHMRVHTGDKPYVCACCKKSFARTDALKRHFRIEQVCRDSPEVKAMKRGRRYAMQAKTENEEGQQQGQDQDQDDVDVDDDMDDMSAFQ